jgi:hypothetical protein
MVRELFEYSYPVNVLLTPVHRSRISSTLKMEAIRSSETPVNKISTRRHMPEDDVLQGASSLTTRFLEGR